MFWAFLHYGMHEEASIIYSQEERTRLRFSNFSQDTEISSHRSNKVQNLHSKHRLNTNSTISAFRTYTESDDLQKVFYFFRFMFIYLIVSIFLVCTLL